MTGKFTHRLNRLLRRGPPRHYRGPEVPEILANLEGFVHGHPEYWQTAPQLTETYFFPHTPRATPALLAQAESVQAGEFRVSSRFPPEKLGFPPDWSANPREDDNWLSSLQSLEWLLPFVHSHFGHPEGRWLGAAAVAVADWIECNPFRRAPSRWSWHDHATAKRLRFFAWFWEHYRTSDSYDRDFARLLLASVYQHVQYHLDERNYRPDSNHGLEATGALAAAALTFSMFSDADRWERIAQLRLEQWVSDNFSAAGFHMEQSPAYHWFVLLRLAALDRFLRANNREHRVLTEATEASARVWPYLLKPNGLIPTVGDSNPTAPTNWRKTLAWRWGREPPPPQTSTIPSASPDAGSFIICPQAGYAIMLAHESPQEADARDTYLLFRCRAFISPHCHYDALSFVLFGLQREWFIDSGFLSYHEWDPRRQYLRSPRAHNLVMIGEGDFRTLANECLEWGRSVEGDYVASYHDLPSGRHTRRLTFIPPRRIKILDHLQPARRRELPWSQLFHLAPDLNVDILSEVEAHLVAPEGARCTIVQNAPGKWRTARGEERPRIQGWTSEHYGEWAPTTTLFFQPECGAREIESTITLHPAPEITT